MPYRTLTHDDLDAWNLDINYHRVNNTSEWTFNEDTLDEELPRVEHLDMFDGLEVGDTIIFGGGTHLYVDVVEEKEPFPVLGGGRIILENAGKLEQKRFGHVWIVLEEA